MAITEDRYEGEFGAHIFGPPIDADDGIELDGKPLALRKTK